MTSSSASAAPSSSSPGGSPTGSPRYLPDARALLAYAEHRTGCAGADPNADCRCGLRALLTPPGALTNPATDPEIYDEAIAVAREVLCRVFDDGADAAMDEWLTWYNPDHWFWHGRALGAFIHQRLQAKRVFTPAERQAVRLLQDELRRASQTKGSEVPMVTLPMRHANAIASALATPVLAEPTPHAAATAAFLRHLVALVCAELHVAAPIEAWADRIIASARGTFTPPSAGGPMVRALDPSRDPDIDPRLIHDEDCTATFFAGGTPKATCLACLYADVRRLDGELSALRASSAATTPAASPPAVRPRANPFELPPERREDWGVPLRYRSDDRDDPDALELEIMRGGNGDWYVSTVKPGEHSIHAVRLATSGGAATRVPGLVTAICDVYDALHFARSGTDDSR